MSRPWSPWYDGVRVTIHGQGERARSNAGSPNNTVQRKNNEGERYGDMQRWAIIRLLESESEDEKDGYGNSRDMRIVCKE